MTMRDDQVSDLQPSASSMKEGPIWLSALAGLTVAGFFFRLHESASNWLSPDEGLYLRAALAPTIWDAYLEGTRHAHPPLFFILLWLLGRVSAEFQLLRFLLILVGTATIPVTYFFIRTLSRSPGALFGAAFVALSPAFVIGSAVVRPYALLYLIFTAIFFRLLRRDGLVSYSALCCWLGFASALHYGSALVAPPLLIFRVYCGWKNHKIPSIIDGVAVSLYAVFLSLLYYVRVASRDVSEWLEYLRDHIYHGLFLQSSTEQLLNILLGLRYLCDPAPVLPFIALFCVGVWALVQRRVYPALILTGLVLFFWHLAAQGGWYPLMGSRHSAMVFPLLVLVVAVGFDELFSPGRKLLLIPLLVFALVTLPLTAFTRQLLIKTQVAPEERILSRQQWEELRQRVLEPRANDTLVVVHVHVSTMLLPLTGRPTPDRIHGPVRTGGITIASIWGWNSPEAQEVAEYLSQHPEVERTVVVTGPWHHRLQELLAEKGLVKAPSGTIGSLMWSEVRSQALGQEIQRSSGSPLQLFDSPGQQSCCPPQGC